MPEQEEEVGIDRDADFYFIVLYLEKTKRGFFPKRTSLKGYLEALDQCLPTEQWWNVEEVVPDYTEFMDTLRFMETADFVDKVEKRKRVELTSKGMRVAGNILDDVEENRTKKIMSVLSDE